MFSAFFYIVLSSFATVISSYAMSMTLRKEATISGYLSIYFLVSLVAVSLLNNVFSFHYSLSYPMASLGGITGVLLILLMIGTGKSLQLGPSGLTFAFLNSGSIIPPLLMTFFFGAAFGFPLSTANVVGMIITVAGLFWAASHSLKEEFSWKWLLSTLFIFFCQGILLTGFQWRCLLLVENYLPHYLIPFHCAETEDLWFMPALFLSAFILQLFFFIFSERRMHKGVEWLGGLVGGVANGVGTFFLLLATKVAAPGEKAMLFPLLAVFIILISSVCGRLFYREKINWVALGILALGIFIGTAF